MDKYARFEAWLRDNGAKFEQLELCEYDTAGVQSGKGRNKKLLKKSSSSLSSSFVESANGGGGEEKKEMTTSSIDDDDDSVDNQNALKKQEEESEMRGIHARTHIPPNTVCMSIPRRCLITVEMGQSTSIGQAIYHSDLDLDAPKHIYLMIYILWDRKVHGNSSFFAPYYDTLPKTLHNMPIFWTPEELAELQGSYLLHQIADRNQAIAEDYHTICAVAPSLQQVCTLEEFKWARMCVCSRNFGLQIDGHRTSALVPHADMLNHYRPRETKWTFDEEQNAFTITTLQHIPAGAQVYDSYGQKCNHRFLLNYGFAVEDNRELDGFCPNEVPIELSIDPDDPNFAEKMEFWTRGEVGYHHQQQQQPAKSYASHLSNSSPNAYSSIAANSGIVQQHHKNNDSTSSSALQEQQQQQHQPHGRQNGSIASRPSRKQSNPTQSPPKTPHLPSSPLPHQNPTPFPGSSSSSLSSSSSSHSNAMKRVRVCVSNNENTRLLFSLLRALACNEAELRAIRAPMSASTSSNLSFYPSHNDTGVTTTSSVARSSAMFGFSSTTPSSHARQFHHHHFSQVLSGTPTSMLSGSVISSSSASSSSTSFFRSCRDIRHPISLRNERSALRLLLDVVGQHLARYPTTFAQDVADLADEEAYPRFSNRRHAKIQVKGEKEVLHHFALWAKTGLDVLQVMEQDLIALEQQWTEQQQQQLSAAATYSGVEVKLTRSGQTVTDESSLLYSPGRSNGSSSMGGSLWTSTSTENFDALIRRMEDTSNLTPPTTAAALSYGRSLHHRTHHATSVEEEEEEDSSASSNSNEVHHTILRYCADVLGSLLREEVKNLKHRLRWRMASKGNNMNYSNNNNNNMKNSNSSCSSPRGRGGGATGGKPKTPRN